MDNGLVLQLVCGNADVKRVLILIVVDNGLVLEGKKFAVSLPDVLILIVVDNGLVPDVTSEYVIGLVKS